MEDVKVYIDISEFLLSFAEIKLIKFFFTIHGITLVSNWNRDF